MLQAFMLGYYVYLPSDPKKSLRMLVSKEVVDALLVAANYLDRNERIPQESLEALRATFHTDGSSKSIIDQYFLVQTWVLSGLQWALGFVCGSNPVTNQEGSASARPEFVALRSLDIEEASMPDIEDESESVVDNEMGSSNEYILIMVYGKFLDKIVKPRNVSDKIALSFEKNAPRLYVVDATDEAYSLFQIPNEFEKTTGEAILGLYYYDLRTSFHFSQVQDIRASNKELYLILYLPLLDVLEDSLPKTINGFDCLARKQRGSLLIDWISFLLEISNSCFTYIALVMPEIPGAATQTNRENSQILKYANVILHKRITYLMPCLEE